MLIHNLINFLHSTPTIIMFGVLFLLCMGMIVLITRFFGKEGLYIYAVVATLSSNIQVLKAVNLHGFDAPVPLGDIVFTTLFLVGDIITECWGKEAAQRCIWLGFVSSLCFSIIMFMVVGMQPIDPTSGADPFFFQTHEAMSLLFTPSFSILAASLIAYFVSLWFDVGIFYVMKKALKDRYLWLRTFVASGTGIIIDTIVFSTLAWVVFAVSSLSLETVVSSYMLNAIKIRMLLTIISIPVFYWVRYSVTSSLQGGPQADEAV